jgi:hypothetical protein
MTGKGSGPLSFIRVVLSDVDGAVIRKAKPPNHPLCTTGKLARALVTAYKKILQL